MMGAIWAILMFSGKSISRERGVKADKKAPLWGFPLFLDLDLDPFHPEGGEAKDHKQKNAEKDGVFIESPSKKHPNDRKGFHSLSITLHFTERY